MTTQKYGALRSLPHNPHAIGLQSICGTQEEQQTKTLEPPTNLEAPGNSDEAVHQGTGNNGPLPLLSFSYPLSDSLPPPNREA